MNILFSVVFAPILALIFLPVKNWNRGLFYVLSIVIATSAIWLSFKLTPDLNYRSDFLQFEIMIDQYSRVFLILINCTWLISIIYSYEFTKYHFQEKRIRFFFFLNTLLTVASLSACAGNLYTLFVFYFIGIPLTYPLIRIRENEEAKRAALQFMIQTGAPALLIFIPAIWLVHSQLGHVSFSNTTTLGANHTDPLLGGVLLALFVIGISKNSVFPFHTWLPKTNPAPAPVSGLLHSVANVKTGSIALIKISIYVFGLDYIHELTSAFLTGGWLIYLCGGTAVYTAYRALTTDDLKRRFAFSTVGQLSYIILAILIGTRTGILAAVLHIITHAIAKSCLFYVAGFYNSIYRTTSVTDIGRIMPHTRFVALVIAVCGLSITGFPFLAGYHSKDLMLIEEWNSHYYASAIFLVIGSVVNIVYIIGPIKNVFQKADPDFEVQPVPLSMMVTFAISIVLIIGSNFYVPYVTALFQ